MFKVITVYLSLIHIEIDSLFNNKCDSITYFSMPEVLRDDHCLSIMD